MLACTADAVPVLRHQGCPLKQQAPAPSTALAHGGRPRHEHDPLHAPAPLCTRPCSRALTRRDTGATEAAAAHVLVCAADAVLCHQGCQPPHALPACGGEPCTHHSGGRCKAWLTQHASTRWALSGGLGGGGKGSGGKGGQARPHSPALKPAPPSRHHPRSARTPQLRRRPFSTLLCQQCCAAQAAAHGSLDCGSCLRALRPPQLDVHERVCCPHHWLRRRRSCMTAAACAATSCCSGWHRAALPAPSSAACADAPLLDCLQCSCQRRHGLWRAAPLPPLCWRHPWGHERR